jgi:hypothetical protein
MDSFKGYIRAHGLPMSIYFDKHTTDYPWRKWNYQVSAKGENQPEKLFEVAA